MACPCCGSETALFDSTSRTDRCPCCGHRWRGVVGSFQANYAAQKGRNPVATPAHRRKLLDRMRDISPLLRQGMAVLEIGCAEGSLGSVVRSAESVTYTGIELSADADEASRVLDRVVRTPAAAMGAESFDLLLAFHVLEHIEHIAAEVAHWRRLLSDTGTLLVEVPNQAGHRLLDADPNVEHLHQFTAASLSALLLRAGFDIRRLESDHAESSVFTDSLRLLATPTLGATQRRARLLDRFRFHLPGPFAAWGIGGDFRGYVEPLLDALPVAALLDNDPAHHGERHGALTVEAYDPERHGRLPILICSIRHCDSIRRTLTALGIEEERIASIDDIFGESA